MAGRYIDIILRVNAADFAAKMNAVAATADSASRRMDSSFTRSQRALGGASRALSGLGRAATYVGGSMAAIGYVSVKHAMDFQTAMERIRTQARQSQGTVDALSKAVLQLGSSGQVQYGPTELANALYHIESVATGNAIPGLTGTSAAMSVLQAATKGAAIGGSSLEDTTTALAGVMAALHAPASQAAAIMGMINTTVGIGNMRMQDLVTAMGSGIIPAFHDYGYSAKDALSAIALFSDQGTKAASSSRQLATALHYLTSPAKKAQEALAYLHIPSQKFIQDAAGPGGIIRALADVQQGMQGLPQYVKNIVLADLFPAGRGRVLLQALDSLKALQGKMGAYGSNAEAVKLLNQAAEAQQHTLSGKLHTAWAQINTDLTKFGSSLIPLIEHYLPMIMKDFEGIFKWLNGLSPATKDFLGKLTVGLVIGGPILMGLGAMLRMFQGIREVVAFLSGSKLIGALLGGSAGAGAAAGAGAGAAAGGEAAGLARFGLPAALLAFLGYSSLSKHHKTQVKHDVGGLLGKGLAWTRPMGQAVNSLLSGHPGAAAQHFGQSVLKSFSSWFGGAQGGLVTTSGIRHLQGGGPIGSDTVPAWLSPGEGVLNRVAMSGLGARGLYAMNSGAGSGNITIQLEPAPVFLDGRLVAKIVLQQTLRKAARGPSGLSGGAMATNVGITGGR